MYLRKIGLKVGKFQLKTHILRPLLWINITQLFKLFTNTNNKGQCSINSSQMFTWLTFLITKIYREHSHIYLTWINQFLLWIIMNSHNLFYCPLHYYIRTMGEFYLEIYSRYASTANCILAFCSSHSVAAYHYYMMSMFEEDCDSFLGLSCSLWALHI